MTVDASGNVYVAGVVYSQFSAIEFAIVKYDAAGGQVWRAVIGDVDATSPALLAADSHGSLYVAAKGYDNGPAYLLVKLDANGIEQWRTTARSGFQGFDQPLAIAVDASGNVYVSGQGDISSLFTLKYDATGAELWRALAGDATHFVLSTVQMAVDSSGNVFVGSTAWAPIEKFIVLKYSPTGAELWRVVPDVATLAYETLVGLGVDDAGDVYVTGTSQDQSANPLTIKYAADGTELWRRTAQYAQYDAVLARGIAVGRSGNAYVAASGIAGITDYSDYLTIGYDAAGVEMWHASSNGGSPSSDRIQAIAADSTSVYVTGSTSPIVSGTRVFTVKYDATTGQESWRSVEAPTGDNESAAFIGLDASGNVYVSGARPARMSAMVWTFSL